MISFIPYDYYLTLLVHIRNCLFDCKKILSFFSIVKVRDLVPESQAYMDLLAFERKLDATIMRKRMDIQEALKRPIKVLLFLYFFTHL